MLFLTIFALLSSSAFSQYDCPEAKNLPDMRNEFGPLRSQDSIGWCFAYATTDLLGHWIRRTHYNGNPSRRQYDTSQRENMLSAMWSTAVYYDNRPEYIRSLRSAHAEKPGLVAKYSDLRTQRRKILEESIHTAQRTPNRELGSLYAEMFALIDKKEKSRENDLSVFQKKYDDIKAKIIALKTRDTAIEAAVAAISKNTEELKNLEKKLDDKQEEKSDLEEGYTEKVFEKLTNKNIGFCRESEVPSDDTQLPQYFSSYKNIDGYLREIYKYLITNGSQDQLKCATLAGYALFPNLTPYEISDILSKYQDQADPIFNLARTACKHKLTIDERFGTPEMITLGNPAKDGFAEIKNLLSQNIPVEIRYNSNRTFLPIEKQKKEKLMHSSIIVGQKYNCDTRETEFIVRDSIGGKENCTSRIAAHGKRKAPFSCDSDGYHVVPQSHLAKYIEGGHAIQSKDAKK